jgi:transcriptional regulator with GAF, ATPase, and Fis domain
VRQALIDCKGNKAQAAKLLGLKNYQNLVNIIKKLKIEIDK